MVPPYVPHRIASQPPFIIDLIIEPETLQPDLLPAFLRGQQGVVQAPELVARVRRVPDQSHLRCEAMALDDAAFDLFLFGAALRMWKCARSMLDYVTQDVNLADVAQITGYPDSWHFSHSIRLVFGLSPKDVFAGSRRLKLHGRIGVLRINNPPVNALSPAAVAGLIEGVAAFEANASLQALLLHCKGCTFVAGANISPFDLPDFSVTPFNSFLARLEQSARPVVAALCSWPTSWALLPLPSAWTFTPASAATRLAIGLPVICYRLWRQRVNA